MIRSSSQHEELAVAIFDDMQALDLLLDDSISENDIAGFLIMEYFPDVVTPTFPPNFEDLTLNENPIETLRALTKLVQRLAIFCRHLLLSQRETVDRLKGRFFSCLIF